MRRISATIFRRERFVAIFVEIFHATREEAAPAIDSVGRIFAVNRNRRLYRRSVIGHIRDLQLGQLLHLFERLVSASRFRFVHFAQRETDMDQNIIAHLHLGRVLRQTCFTMPPKVRFAHPHAVARRC